MTSTHPPIPAGFRPATPKDIPRLGVIFVAAFHYSPLLSWSRPYSSTYPSDTLTWYTNESIRYLASKQFIVLVAEDTFDPEEQTQTKAVFTPGEQKQGTQGLKNSDTCIVALATWDVGEERRRQWRLEGGSFLKNASFPEPQVYLGRDRCDTHYDALVEKVVDAEKRLMDGMLELTMLATHPAYWGKGYGTKLVRWGLEYARNRGIGMGVFGPEMGMKVYLKEGFEKETLEWEGDEITPQGLTCSIATYVP